jgi:DNA-binding HxlR family transcriptional regulator
MSNHNHSPDNIYKFIDILWKKWMLLIIHEFLHKEEVRFNDIKNSIEWISSKILSSRLTELEKKWFINRSVKNEKPIIISYSSTKQTKDSLPIFQELMNWSNKWQIK